MKSIVDIAGRTALRKIGLYVLLGYYCLLIVSSVQPAVWHLNEKLTARNYLLGAMFQFGLAATLRWRRSPRGCRRSLNTSIIGIWFMIGKVVN